MSIFTEPSPSRIPLWGTETWSSDMSLYFRPIQVACVPSGYESCRDRNSLRR